jgi:hypothetical protein
VPPQTPFFENITSGDYFEVVWHLINKKERLHVLSSIQRPVSSYLLRQAGFDINVKILAYIDIQLRQKKKGSNPIKVDKLLAQPIKKTG